MTTKLKPTPHSIYKPADDERDPCAISEAHRRRPAWRRRLVDAERGFTLGMRGDSVFFVHFFAGVMIVVGGFALGLAFLEWTILILALTGVLATEIMNKMFRSVWDQMEPGFRARTRELLRIGAAAVVVTMFGAGVTIAMIFGRRFYEIFAG